MPFISWPNSNLLSTTSGLSTAICIGSLSGNLTALLTGGMAVYAALSVFKDAMREVTREIAPPLETPVARVNDERATQQQVYGFDGGFADMNEVADRMSSPWPSPVSPLEKAIANAAGRHGTPAP